MVTKVTPHIGLTIALPGGKTGKVSIFHLSDTYTEDPLKSFKVGKIVRSVVVFLVPSSCKALKYSPSVTSFSLP